MGTPCKQTSEVVDVQASIKLEEGIKMTLKSYEAEIRNFNPK